VAARHYDQPTSAAYKHWYYLGSALFMYLNWQLCTWLGLSLGQLIPNVAAWGLDFAMPVTFLGMVVPYLKNRAMVVTVLVSGLVSILAYNMPNKLGLFLAAVAGIGAGIMVENMSGKVKENADE
jgi:predicted branched-subunit amino acid permease